MAPTLSIIIPHKPGPKNNQALELAISSIVRGTFNSYELLIDTETPKDPYKIWNEMALAARSDILVFTNSDVIFAPHWDEYWVYNMAPNAIFTGYLVEPGNIGVAPENIQVNFGLTPETFERQNFERWADLQIRPYIIEQRGWYMPCALDREWFLGQGGFDTTIGFPHPNDILFWEKALASGAQLFRTHSYAYHFQNLSGRD